MTENRTIVVTGATGQQGGATARHLLADGWRVRALVRDSAAPRAQELVSEGAELVTGDMLDPHSLRDAFDGAHGVFSVQTWRGPGGVDEEKRAGMNVAEAAGRTGVKHLVYASVGAADRAPELAHFASKREIEVRIGELGIPATILRPVFFMDNFRWQAAGIREGRLVQGAKPDTRLQMIAVDDIGAFAALAFADHDRWTGRTITLAGDELTLVEAAAVFARQLGRPVTYTPAHEDRPGGGDTARKMAAWFDTHSFNADIPALRDIYPPLKELRTFVAEAGWLAS
jgi:uncharacterized protein YbjT (DUF2867 family)